MIAAAGVEVKPDPFLDRAEAAGKGHCREG